MDTGHLNAIAVFSGAGGFSLGVNAAGFTTRLCTDIDYHACRTLRENRRAGRDGRIPAFLQSAAVLRADIRTLSIDRILRAARLERGEVAMLYGGPPCQSFSVFGRRGGLQDPRGQLLWEYVRVLRGIRPSTFILENVPGLASIDDGRVYARLLEELERDERGRRTYAVKAYLLNAADFGVPQYRQRLIIFGSLEGEIPPPEPTHSPEANEQLGIGLLRPTPTVGQVLRGLPEPPAGDPPNHIGREHSQRIVERYAALQFGERDPVTRINKLHPDRPSYTIIVGSDKGGGKGHVHPFVPREVTPRESARLQTFPDFWAFSGTSRHPIRQVGNAVPPVFGAHLAAHVASTVFGVRKPTHDEIVARLHLPYLSAEELQLELIN